MMNKVFERRYILASGSPRRRELLGGLGVEFEVHPLDVDESYPNEMKGIEVPLYLAEKKADAFDERGIQEDQVVIAADTIVLLDDEILTKPANDKAAKIVLKKLSGETHQVITGVCIRDKSKKKSFSVSTQVHFKVLSDEEIAYYVERFKPFDKAGGYGIQEWIGFVGIDYIKGSYFNVVGLPVQHLYDELLKF